jgi:2-methylaconitate cis-trans-isomerase PrpF
LHRPRPHLLALNLKNSVIVDEGKRQPMSQPTVGKQPGEYRLPLTPPTSCPATLYRGGTSKGVLIRAEEVAGLPDEQLEDWIRAVMGSADPRQIDGLGGADMLSSKFGLVGPAANETYDVDFSFFQVGFKEPTIARDAACGNLSAAAALFAIEEGLVTRQGETTNVRIHEINTDSLILAQVENVGSEAHIGEAAQETGTRVWLDFAASAGCTTGALLPTGQRTNRIHVEDLGPLDVSVVDLANLVAFIRAEDIGLTGTETPDDIAANPDLLGTLERIRATVAVLLGLSSDPQSASVQAPGVPFLAILSTPETDTSYPTPSLKATGFAMRSVHRAYWATGAVCTAVAAQIPGTLAYELATPLEPNQPFRLRHPAGFLDVRAEVQEENTPTKDTRIHVRQAQLLRTARRMMTGTVHVPAKYPVAPSTETVETAPK